MVLSISNIFWHFIKSEAIMADNRLYYKEIQYPMHDDVTFRRAGKVEDEEGENLEIDFSK